MCVSCAFLSKLDDSLSYESNLRGKAGTGSMYTFLPSDKGFVLTHIVAKGVTVAMRQPPNYIAYLAYRGNENSISDRWVQREHEKKRRKNRVHTGQPSFYSHTHPSIYPSSLYLSLLLGCFFSSPCRQWRWHIYIHAIWESQPSSNYTHTTPYHSALPTRLFPFKLC